MTASVTGSPREVSASRLIFCSTRALISCGVYCLPSISGDFQLVPISRLTLRMVRSTLVTAWFLADWPTRTSPFLAKATTDGVVREPSELAMTVGSPPSRTVTTELVVPRSIPTARAMGMASLPLVYGWCRVWWKPTAHLAWGPLNFPAHPNGRDPDHVPGVARFLRALPKFSTRFLEPLRALPSSPSATARAGVLDGYGGCAAALAGPGPQVAGRHPRLTPGTARLCRCILSCAQQPTAATESSPRPRPWRRDTATPRSRT